MIGLRHISLSMRQRRWFRFGLIVLVLLGLFSGLGETNQLVNRLDAHVPSGASACPETIRHSTGLSDLLRTTGLIDSSKTWAYVLEQGEQALFSRAWLTENCAQTIDIQYFIFSMDNVGIIALDHLIQAANRGVQVRMLVDDILLDVAMDDIEALNAHPGIEIRIYNPNAGSTKVAKWTDVLTDFRGFNQRMHNKTFIADGRIAITGGRNIADEYFDYDQDYNFRDRDVLLIGQGAEDVQSSFDAFWNHPLAVSIQKANLTNTHSPATLFQKIHDYACDAENFWPEIREMIDEIPDVVPEILEKQLLHELDDMEFISDVPGKNDEGGYRGGGISLDVLTTWVHKAETSLTIQSPYLILTEEGISLFASAVSRGVKVRILTNSLSSTDNLEAFGGYQRCRNDLLKAGVDVYEFRPDAAIRKQLITAEKQRKSNYLPTFGLHAKSMVVDHHTTIIGTFNMDPRSANLNTECAAIMTSESMARQVEALMLVELNPENAWRTTLDWNPDREAGGWKQLMAWSRRWVPASFL